MLEWVRGISESKHLRSDYQSYVVPYGQNQRSHCLSALACHILQMETLSWPSHVDAEFLGERRHTPNVAVHKKRKTEIDRSREDHPHSGSIQNIHYFFPAVWELHKLILKSYYFDAFSNTTLLFIFNLKGHLNLYLWSDDKMLSCSHLWTRGVGDAIRGISYCYCGWLRSLLLFSSRTLIL